MTRYFAYGSNLVTGQMKQRCPSFAANPSLIGRGRLNGYQLTFPVRSRLDWAGGVAGIEPSDDGDAVHGVVYGVDDAALADLDIYEDVPGGLYRRLDVTVTLDDGEPCDCITYFAIARGDGPFRPSRRYLDAIIAGAREHRLPASWIKQLEQTPTLES
jgi:gamma-glutamylcyclotransferase (GGCT)/AIG2-like uncharacterized protein YtfP